MEVVEEAIHTSIHDTLCHKAFQFDELNFPNISFIQRGSKLQSEMKLRTCIIREMRKVCYDLTSLGTTGEPRATFA